MNELRAKVRKPAALHAAGFGRLTLAWVFTNLADIALYLMVAVWVKDLSGSDVAAGLVFAALGLPAVLSPVLGQIADRVSRRKLVVAANLGVSFPVAALFFVTSSAQLWLIYTVVFLYGTMSFPDRLGSVGVDPRSAAGRAPGLGQRDVVDHRPSDAFALSPFLGRPCMCWLVPMP